VKRQCFHFKSSSIYNRHIYIDAENAEEIYSYIQGNQKKFSYIIRRILEQNYMYYDDYKKIEIYGKKGLSEMRVHPNGQNGRIYCKEISNEDGQFFVIAIKVLLKKKSQKINKEIEDSIKGLLDYEYDI
jgi:hypothetical protein